MPEQQTHPSPGELSAFSLGQLPPDQAAAVESHISDCQPCCETLLGLSSDDTFVALLQEAQRPPSDQTVDQNEPTRSSQAGDIPAPLADHPRYEILGLIGKGGMGDVFKARHRVMERTVALKVINHELVRRPEAVDRFHREVKTAARLSHPNIVTAYDAEQAGDLHFLVMEYVDGVDLARLVKDRGPLQVGEACEYIRQAAIGLQYAHEQGMVHRDIKPHNLMATLLRIGDCGLGIEEDAVATDQSAIRNPQSAVVKILDFGLASLAPEAPPSGDTVEERGDLTAAGTIMGTPDFISPEQADDAHRADIRSDIYSLGATLYYLLSGRAPFAEGSVMQKLKSHAQAEPEPLGAVRDDVPQGLAEIIRRAMAKDPAERFQTPEEFAAALQPFLQLPTSASDLKPRPKTQRRVRSRRLLWLACLGIPLAALLIAAGIVFYVRLGQTTIRFDVVDERLAIRFGGERISISNDGHEIHVTPGKNTFVVERDGLEVETATFTLKKGQKVALQASIWMGEPNYTTTDPKLSIERRSLIDLEPPQTAAAVRTPKVLVVGIDGLTSAALRAAHTPYLDRLAELGVFSENCDVLGPRDSGADTTDEAGWSTLLTGVWPDKHGVLADDFETAKLADYPSFLTRLKQIRPQAVTASVVGAGDINKNLVDADLEQETVSTNYDVALTALKWLSRAELSAMFVQLPRIGSIGELEGFDPKVWRYNLEVERADGQVGAMLGAIRRRPTFGQENWLIIVASTHGGEGKSHLNGRNKPKIRNVPLIVSGAGAIRGTIETAGLVDVAATALAHLGVPIDDAWRMDGHALGLRSPPPRVPQKAIAVEELLRFEGTPDSQLGIPGHNAYVISLDFDSEGRRLVTGSGMPECKGIVWDARNGRVLSTYSRHHSTIYQALFSPNDKLIAMAHWNGVVTLWDPDDGQEVGRIEGQVGRVEHVTFSPSGKLIATGTTNFGDSYNRDDPADIAVRLFDVESRELIREIRLVEDPRDHGGVWDVNFSADGERLLVSVELQHGSQIRFQVSEYAVETGKLIRHLYEAGGEGSKAHEAIYSPDGRWIATAHGAETLVGGKLDDPERSVVRLWNAETGRLERTFRGHRSTIHGLDISPDGALLVTMSGRDWINADKVEGVDYSMRIWDVATGKELLKQELPRTGQFAQFSPDGKRIATAYGGVDEQTLLQLWRVTTENQPADDQADNGLADRETIPSVAPAPIPLEDPKRLEDQLDIIQAIRVTPDAKHFLVAGGGSLIIRDAATLEVERTIQTDRRGTRAIAVSPDSGQVATGGNDGVLRLWSLNTGEQMFSEDLEMGIIEYLAWSPDGDVILMKCIDAPDGGYVEWDVAARRLGKTFAAGGQAMTYSPDGALVAAGTRDGTVHVWNAATGEVELRLDAHTERCFAVEFTKDGKRLLTGSHDGKVRIWNVESGELLTTIEHADRVTDAVWLENERYLVTSSFPLESIYVWDLETETMIARAEGVHTGIMGIEPLPDGRRIATAPTVLKITPRSSETVAVSVWKLPYVAASPPLPVPSEAPGDGTSAGFEKLRRLEGHPTAVQMTAFTPQTNRLISAGAGHILVWNVDTGAVERRIETDRLNTRALIVSPDGKRIATGGHDGKVNIFDLETGERELTFAEHAEGGGQVEYMAWSPQGDRIASKSWSAKFYSGADGKAELILWDAKTGEVVRRFDEARTAQMLEFSPDGSRLVAGDNDHSPNVWDAGSGELLFELKAHSGKVKAVAFSRDGRWILTGSSDGSCRIWNAKDGSPERILHSGDDEVGSLAVLPDGRSIVVASNDHLWLYDLQTGQLPAEEADLKIGDKLAVSVNADGTLLATAETEAHFEDVQPAGTDIQIWRISNTTE